jgi:hypothetical protein
LPNSRTARSTISSQCALLVTSPCTRPIR